MDKNNSYKVLLIIFLIVVMDIIAWWLLKKYHLSKQYCYLYLAVLVYALLPLVIIQVLKYEGIGTTNMIWNIFSTVFVLLMGYFIFRETLSHTQLLGILFGVTAIILIAFGHK